MVIAISTLYNNGDGYRVDGIEGHGPTSISHPRKHGGVVEAFCYLLAGCNRDANVKLPVGFRLDRAIRLFRRTTIEINTNNRMSHDDCTHVGMTIQRDLHCLFRPGHEIDAGLTIHLSHGGRAR